MEAKMTCARLNQGEKKEQPLGRKKFRKGLHLTSLAPRQLGKRQAPRHLQPDLKTTIQVSIAARHDLPKDHIDAISHRLWTGILGR